MGRLRLHTCMTIVLLFSGGCTGGTEEIDFNAEVRPILNDRCMRCHGGVRQQGGFSLLTRTAALGPTEAGRPAIHPGQPARSELIRRITSADGDERMPAEGPPLALQEVEILRRWIAQGAPWSLPWAFIPPDPELRPPPLDAPGGHNGIDAFVRQRLDDLGGSPSPEAGRATLLRRLSLDLIGLPPSVDEVDAFLADTTEGAYERQVDRLLASPHYGERWAAMWLDLARYGDSQGYQKDPLRPHIWRYRDWVIHALNSDQPFDQFTIDQLAGDLLPDPTPQQVLATAFHRNTNTNDEGGTDNEEFRVAAVLDRVNTTFEVWQGLTVGCVQCHGHPYDPIHHSEYYGLVAFFNNTADADRPDEAPRQVLPAHSPIHGPGAVPIMKELPPDSSRTTTVFVRGNWLVPGDTVQPHVPRALPPLPPGAPRNRLGLARWLVDPGNPLTARLLVNRLWAQLFGTGLVATLEDFGTQGAPPSHPALLDWLAVRAMHAHGWHLKSILRDMVLSATYRQTTHADSAAYALDPDNRYLARGPRLRLSAEQVRDQALFVGGLLNARLYGPSVMPPQPEGTWNVIRHSVQWTSSDGQDRYRRALYTLWRKTSPYPSMVLFDSPSRELCLSRRIPTNTPLQALVTLNDPVYVEAAWGLAHRMGQAASDPQEQLIAGYRMALAIAPEEEALTDLLALYQRSLAYFEDRPQALEALRPEDPPSPAAAARFNVANVLMNLDAFIMKG